MGRPPENCKERVAEELIVGYTARTLAPEEEIAFERHLESCARCRQMTAQQGAVWSALDAWRPPRISADFDRKLAQRIAQAQSLSPLAVFRNWIWRPALPLAAVSGLLIGMFLLKHDDWSSHAIDSRPSIGIEQQVEHALDDMDMLKQIGADVSPAGLAPAQKI